MTLKLRFWSPAEKKFLNEVRCWCSYDGIFQAIGTSEQEVIVQVSSQVHDKDGWEIFEGDILKYQGRIGRVIFFAGMFVCAWDDETEDELAYMLTKDMEVTGHIFETE